MKQPKRDWSAAREKVEREGHCRLGGGYVVEAGLCTGVPEAAHIIGREHDKKPRLNGEPSPMWGKQLMVWPERIVPLCRRHHQMYDAHGLDLLPYLTIEEQAQAVLDAGGIELARRRTVPLTYRSEVT